MHPSNFSPDLSIRIEDSPTGESYRKGSHRRVEDLTKKRTRRSRKDEGRPFIVSRYLINSDNSFRLFNGIGLSETACNNLFGSPHSIAGRVRLANTVYPFKAIPLPMGYDVLVSDVVAEQILLKEPKYVCVHKVADKNTQIGSLSVLSFSVKAEGPLNGSIPCDACHQISKHSLEMMVRQLLEDDIFSLEKRLFIEHPVGPLSLKVYRMEVKEQGLGLSPSYGLIDGETRLFFHSSAPEKLVIVEEVPSHLIEIFSFAVMKVENIREKQFFSEVGPTGNRYDWTQGAPLLPVVAPLDSLCKTIQSAFSRRVLKELDEGIISFGPWSLTVQFKKVRLNSSAEEIASFVEEETSNVKGYELSSSNKIAVSGCRQIHLTCSEEFTVTPKVMSFEIVESYYPDQENEGTNTLQWVCVSELERALRNQQALMTLQSIVKIETRKGMYRLKITGASGYLRTQDPEFKNALPLFRIAPSTKVHINLGVSDSTVITENDTPLSVTNVKIEIMKFSPVMRRPKRFLSESSKNSTTMIERDELKALLRASFEGSCHFVVGQQIGITTARGEPLTLQIASAEVFNQEEGEGGEYAKLLIMHPNTDIEFEVGEGQNLLLSGRVEPLQIRDLSQKMLDLGIGGLGTEFKTIVKKILLARTEYSSHLKKIRQTPPRGILLWGPPGTGKTKIARSLQKLLQVPEQNVKMINGSEIWDKWLGESERKVRELFEPAQADQKKYGDQSPLHLLIIDEMDSFLQPRESAERGYQKSVVDAFIASLDGISSKSSESLNNIVVVGLTNHKDQIDDAVIRQGRLGTHIHIKLPDAEGRKEIFQIYLDPLYKEGLVAADVDLNQLAAWTVGRTGAFIEAVVQTATSYSTDRIYEQQIPSDVLHSHPLAKVSNDDLFNAIEECKWQKAHEEDVKGHRFTASLELSAEAVKEDLARKGLVAVPPEVLDFFSRLRIRERHGMDLRAAGLHFRKGALFYGEAGTGKTEVAKSLKDLFTLDRTRFQYVRVSELWGDSGDLLRKDMLRLVQPAKESVNDLHGNAPMHVLVLDNIDALYWRFQHPDRIDASVLQRFLTELDSLLEEEDQRLDNLVVIGIANRPFPLDSGTLHSSALGVHIHFTPPASEGRKALFEKKLSSLYERGLVSDDVDLDLLVGHTEGMTPRGIENLILNATVHSLRSSVNFALCPLKMEDFEAALREGERGGERERQQALSMYC